MRMASASLRRGGPMAALAAFALGAMIFSGCGGTDDSPSATGTQASPLSTPSGVPQGRPPQAAADASEGTSAGARDAKRPAGGAGDGSSSTGSSTTRTAPADGAPDSSVGGQGRQDGGGDRVAHSNSERCPSGVSRDECEAIAEQVDDTPSHSVSSAEACVKAVGKSQCEKLLQAESATSGGAPAIDIDACMKKPTPRCEAALRPILEAERAASNAK